MDIRIKRAVQLSAFLDVVVLAATLIVVAMFLPALQAVGYLFLLPLVLLWCGLPIGAALLDWLIVKSKAHSGRLQFIFYYLIITRLLLLAALLYVCYGAYINDPLRGVELLWFYVVGFVAVLITGVGSVTLTFNVLNKRRAVSYGLFIILTMILTAALAYTVYVIKLSPASSLPGKGSRTDKQAEYDIYLLRQDVWSYFIQEKKLPATFREAISMPQSYGKSIPSERLKAYEYKPNSDGRQYDICATFATDTSAKEHANNPEVGHKAGYYCVHYNNK